MATFASFVDQFKTHERLLRDYKQKPEGKYAFLRKSSNRNSTAISPEGKRNPKLRKNAVKAAALLCRTPVHSSKPLGQLPNIYSKSNHTKFQAESPIIQTKLQKPALISCSPIIRHTTSSTELVRFEEEKDLKKESKRESAISVIQMEEDPVCIEPSLEEPPKPASPNIKRLIALQKMADDITIQQKSRSSVRLLPRTQTTSIEEKSEVVPPLTITRNGVKYSIKNLNSVKLPLQRTLIKRGTIDFTHNAYTKNSIEQYTEQRSRLDSLGSINSLGGLSKRFEVVPKPETPEFPEEPGSVPVKYSPLYSVKTDMRKWNEIYSKINGYFDKAYSPEERLQRALRKDSEQMRLEKGKSIMKRLSLTDLGAYKGFG